MDAVRLPRRVWLHDVAVDLDTGDVTMPDGSTCRLQRQPLRILQQLVLQAGAVVAREDLATAVWAGVHVDYEHGLNFCIRQVRAALGDTARTARFVETLPRHGYRLVAPVSSTPPSQPFPVASATRVAADALPSSRPVRSAPTAFWFAAGLVVLVAVVNSSLVPNRRAAVAPAGDAAAAMFPAEWDRLVRAQMLLNRAQPRDAATAIELLVALTKSAPDSADGHAALADAWVLAATSGTRSPRDAYRAAETAARRALALRPDHAPAAATLGTVMFRLHWRWADAARLFATARRSPVVSAGVLRDHAWFLAAIGQRDAAYTTVRQAVHLDPVSRRTSVEAAWILTRARRYDEAIAQARRTLDIDPGAVALRFCLECAYVHTGRYGEALTEVRAAAPDDTDWSGLPADPRQAVKRVDEVRLARLIDGGREASHPYRIAVQAAAAGHDALAMTWLGRAVQARDPEAALIVADPIWDRLRDEPRLQQATRAVGIGDRD